MKNPVSLLTATLLVFILGSIYLRNSICPCGIPNTSTTAVLGAASILVSNDDVKKNVPLKINVKPSQEFVFHFSYNRRHVVDVGTMTELKAYLQQNPNNAITITGHADSIGDDEYNQRLSEDRAEFIMSRLIREGVDATQITTVGNGETKPIASNNTPQGRYENRRVVVQIFS